MLSEAKERFFQAKAAEGRSTRTLTNYGEAIDQFLGFFLASDPGRTLLDVEREDVEAFLVHLRRHGRGRRGGRLADNTLANRFRTLRTFFNFCLNAELIPSNPMKGMNEPRVRQDVVKPYTREEIASLFAATRRWPALALRDQVILSLLYNTGIRAGELCNLRPKDVQEDRILVRGKGNKERWVGLEPTTTRLLHTYLVGHSRRTVFGLSVSGLHQRLKALAWAAEPRVEDAHAHRFRDTFAVAFLSAGGGLQQLQDILGHEKIETTLRYVQYGRAERALADQRRYAPFAVREAGPLSRKTA